MSCIATVVQQGRGHEFRFGSSMKTLVIFAGLPGVGKTTLCKLLKKKIKCYFFNSDEFAKKSKLFEQISTIGFDKARERFYDAKANRIKSLFNTHNIIIMDAVFDKEILRRKFYKLAKLINVKLIIVEVVAPAKFAIARIKKNKTRNPASRIKVYRAIKKNWEPIKRKHIIMHYDKNRCEQINKLTKNITDNHNT